VRVVGAVREGLRAWAWAWCWWDFRFVVVRGLLCVRGEVSLIG
jgi:hypothetical protein